MKRGECCVQRLECRRHLHAGHDHFSTEDFAVNVGGPEYVGRDGQTWQADHGFKAGRHAQVVTSDVPVTGTDLPAVYQSSRRDYNMAFSAEVPDGRYAVTLGFVEQQYRRAGDRTFSVYLEDHRVATHMDVLKEAGGRNRALDKRYVVNVTGGTLDLRFLTNVTRATLSAIRVEPATPVASAESPPSSPSAVSSTKLNWYSRKNAPISREEAVSFVAYNKLYVVGGYYNTKFQATTRVDVYDYASNTWSRKKDAPTKITHAGVATDPRNGKVWMVGGFIGDFPGPKGTAAVWVYNPATDSWASGPALPEKRAAGGSAIVNNKLYYFTGSYADRNGDSSKSFVLDLGHTDAGWKPVANFPSPRNHFGTVAVGTKIFFIGGQSGLEDRSVYKSSVYVYDTVSNTYSATTSLPRPYSHFTSTLSLYKNRYVLIAGGEDPHNTALGDVRVFDTVTRKWTSLTGLPEARRQGAGGVLGNQYVVTGGYKYMKNMLSQTWAADLSSLGLA